MLHHNFQCSPVKTREFNKAKIAFLKKKSCTLFCALVIDSCNITIHSLTSEKLHICIKKKSTQTRLIKLKLRNVQKLY